MQEYEDPSEEEAKYFFVSELKTSNKVAKPWYVDILFHNNVSIKFKIDTAAEVNVLPMRYVNKLSLSKDDIVKCNVVLVCYSNNSMRSPGKVNLQCKCNNQSKNIEFVLVNDDKAEAILGLDTCLTFNLIKRVDSLECTKYKTVDDILKLYPSVFTGIGRVDYNYHIKIDPTISPIVHPPRRISLSLQPKLKHTLKKLEEQEIIEKVDYPTDWVNSMVIVEKKTGDLRLCLDPRDLNRAIKREHFMIPTAQDVVTKLSGKKIFTVIDMSSGFWHIQLDKESADLCCFNTCFGRYKWLKMPFGIKSASEVFQKMVFRIFGYIKGVQVIFDDLIIAAVSEEEHDRILKEVIKTA
ncbi:hypothetical protein Zmor_001635 [Zophobas morio]|uniref:Reverse transcriptase domain-containing protein n=1 Tax=Zophobas morio TaxID=2755281 RepID=A0AA38IYT7_9CUCU|nr:hypothetical protein Zmor_001635 [Zophobas morio]